MDDAVNESRELLGGEGYSGYSRRHDSRAGSLPCDDLSDHLPKAAATGRPPRRAYNAEGATGTVLLADTLTAPLTQRAHGRACAHAPRPLRVLHGAPTPEGMPVSPSAPTLRRTALLADLAVARQAGPIARQVACAAQRRHLPHALPRTPSDPCEPRRRPMTERQSIIRPKVGTACGRAVSTTALGPTEGYSAVLTGSKAPGQTRTCALAGSTARFATKSDLFPNDDLGRGCAVCVRLRVRTSRDRLADPKTPGASAQG